MLTNARPKVILAAIGADERLNRKASGEQFLKATAQQKMDWSEETTIYSFILETSHVENL